MSQQTTTVLDLSSAFSGQRGFSLPVMVVSATSFWSKLPGMIRRDTELGVDKSASDVHQITTFVPRVPAK